MNAYLLELLTYLFRLCFNQCNASLHFGSSKHSAYFQNPPSHSLFDDFMISYYFPMVVLVPNIFVSSRCCFPNDSYIQIISHKQQGWYSISLVVHLPTNFAACRTPMHPLVCIRFLAFIRDSPAVSTAKHPSVPT